MMRVQIVTYNLNGISEEDYLDVASQLADRFSALPGLQAKLWLEHPQSGTYGAVYFWDDEESMQRFVQSDLFEGTNPEFSNLVSEDFAVLRNLTMRTQPVLEVLESASPAYAPPPLPPLDDDSPADEIGMPVAAVPAKKARTKKAGAKTVGAKKVGAKKAGAKKAAIRKAPAAAGAVEKVRSKKSGAKKSGAKKSGAKKVGRPRKI